MKNQEGLLFVQRVISEHNYHLQHNVFNNSTLLGFYNETNLVGEPGVFRAWIDSAYVHH